MDREQRNERTRLRMRVETCMTVPHRGHDGMPGSPDETCVRCNGERAFAALLAELEQAERERDEARMERDVALDDLDAVDTDEARLAKVPALVEALRDAQQWLVIPSDVPEQHHETLARVRQDVRDALAAFEQDGDGE